MVIPDCFLALPLVALALVILWGLASGGSRRPWDQRRAMYFGAGMCAWILGACAFLIFLVTGQTGEEPGPRFSLEGRIITLLASLSLFFLGIYLLVRGIHCKSSIGSTEPMSTTSRKTRMPD
jgi:hypothetical protein